MPSKRSPHTNKNPRPGSPEFAELEAEWYRRLADTGFQDIEDTSTEFRRLKTSERTREARSVSKYTAEQTLDYYRSATDAEFLSTVQFRTPLHRFIWTLHAAGMTMREIEETISPCVDAVGRTTICLMVYEVARQIPGSRL